MWTEIVRTNDPVVISVVDGLLTEEDLPHYVTDRTISVIEGSINAIQVRILVLDGYVDRARDVLTEAELGHWLQV